MKSAGKLPSISDVAKKAKVSKTTVSMVLNSKGSISGRTRDRVHRVCEELKYQPHPTAQFLPRLRTRRLGRVQTGVFSFTAVMEPNALSSYSDFLDGVADVAAARGKMVVFQPTTLNSPVASTVTFQMPIEGRLMIGLVDDSQLDRFARDEVPVVVMGDHECDRPVWNVNLDAYAAGQMAVNHLWSLGHRRIALQCQARDSRYQVDLRRGFEDALARKEVRAGDYLILSNDTTSEHFLDSIKQRAPGVTAFVTIGGGCVLHVMLKAREAGLVVPRDLSVLHFGPDERTDASTVLTRIDPVSREIGRLAMELLIGLSEKGGQSPARTLLQPKLVEGETCRAL